MDRSYSRVDALKVYVWTVKREENEKDLYPLNCNGLTLRYRIVGENNDTLMVYYYGTLLVAPCTLSVHVMHHEERGTESVILRRND